MTGSSPPGLILASGSPRRADAMRQLGLPFEIRPAEVPEILVPDEPPELAVVRLARDKAGASAQTGYLAVGADTLVVIDGEVLAKPESPADATRMLARLAGRDHTVLTGMAVASAERIESAVEDTVVRFRPLDAPEIAAYVATGEPLDKAGSYGIQGFGASLVERVEGDYFNVLGFPIGRFQELLRRFGWSYDFGKLLTRPTRLSCGVRPPIGYTPSNCRTSRFSR